MDIKEIKDLILAINNTDIERVEIEKENSRIMITKGNSNKNNSHSPLTSNQKENFFYEEAEQISENTSDEDLFIVKSPMVGVYYESPSPNEDPFVKVGSKVEKGQILCILEAMKLMNEIESEVSGQIVEIMVKNEDTVEYGQTLMKIRR